MAISGYETGLRLRAGHAHSRWVAAAAFAKARIQRFHSAAPSLTFAKDDSETKFGRPRCHPVQPEYPL